MTLGLPAVGKMQFVTKNAATQWPPVFKSLSVWIFSDRISWNLDQTSCCWPKVWLCKTTSNLNLHMQSNATMHLDWSEHGHIETSCLSSKILCKIIIIKKWNSLHTHGPPLPLSLSAIVQTDVLRGKPVTVYLQISQAGNCQSKQLTHHDERKLPFIWLISTFQRLPDSFPIPDTPTEKEALIIAYIHIFMAIAKRRQKGLKRRREEWGNGVVDMTLAEEACYKGLAFEEITNSAYSPFIFAVIYVNVSLSW